MTRPVVEKHLKQSIKWSDDWSSNAEQWMDNFHACRGDLIEESLHLELWRLAAITGWVASILLLLMLVVKP